jgi:hypothetical protein
MTGYDASELNHPKEKKKTSKKKKKEKKKYALHPFQINIPHSNTQIETREKKKKSS